jgi:hypothetical protein
VTRPGHSWLGTWTWGGDPAPTRPPARPLVARQPRENVSDRLVRARAWPLPRRPGRVGGAARRSRGPRRAEGGASLDGVCASRPALRLFSGCNTGTPQKETGGGGRVVRAVGGRVARSGRCRGQPRPPLAVIPHRPPLFNATRGWGKTQSCAPCGPRRSPCGMSAEPSAGSVRALFSCSSPAPPPPPREHLSCTPPPPRQGGIGRGP